MGYYKQGCDIPTHNKGCVALVEKADSIGALDLPEPLPTLILYGLMVLGGIFWVKAGGF